MCFVTHRWRIRSSKWPIAKVNLCTQIFTVCWQQVWKCPQFLRRRITWPVHDHMHAPLTHLCAPWGTSLTLNRLSSTGYTSHLASQCGEAAHQQAERERGREGKTRVGERGKRRVWERQGERGLKEMWGRGIWRKWGGEAERRRKKRKDQKKGCVWTGGR